MYPKSDRASTTRRYNSIQIQHKWSADLNLSRLSLRNLFNHLGIANPNLLSLTITRPPGFHSQVGRVAWLPFEDIKPGNPLRIFQSTWKFPSTMTYHLVNITAKLQVATKV